MPNVKHCEGFFLCLFSAKHTKTPCLYLLQKMGETAKEYIAARFMVNNHTWRMNDYDVLYAINKEEIKKGGTVYKTPALSAKPGSSNSSTISIADVLNLVKAANSISAVVSNDVVQRLGLTRPVIKEITPNLKYSKEIREAGDEIQRGQAGAGKDVSHVVAGGIQAPGLAA